MHRAWSTFDWTRSFTDDYGLSWQRRILLSKNGSRE